MNDFIKAQGISFSYHVEEGQQPVSVFEDLDVTIHEGEWGENLAGFSPFFRKFLRAGRSAPGPLSESAVSHPYCLSNGFRAP